MGRLINTDDFLALLGKSDCDLYAKFVMQKTPTADATAELTADAVSIVRCKDCKHLCDMQTCYICSVTVSCIKDMDGFCSRGERKV